MISCSNVQHQHKLWLLHVCCQTIMEKHHYLVLLNTIKVKEIA